MHFRATNRFALIACIFFGSIQSGAMDDLDNTSRLEQKTGEDKPAESVAKAPPCFGAEEKTGFSPGLINKVRTNSKGNRIFVTQKDAFSYSLSSGDYWNYWQLSEFFPNSSKGIVINDMWTDDDNHIYIASDRGFFEHKLFNSDWWLSLAGFSVGSIYASKEHIFAATDKGLYFRRRDDKNSWKRFTNTEIPHIVEALAVSGSSDGTFLVVKTKFCFFSSIDEGKTWTKWRNSPDAATVKAPIEKLVVSPDKRLIYMRTFNNGLWVSDNVGRNWNLETIFSKIQVNDIFLIPKAIYAATEDGVYFANLEDRKWHKLEALSEPVNSIFASPDGARLYIAIKDTLMIHSLEDGKAIKGPISAATAKWFKGSHLSVRYSGKTSD